MGFAACLPLLSYAKRPSNPDLMCFPDPFHLSCGLFDFLLVQPQAFI